MDHSLKSFYPFIRAARWTDALVAYALQANVIAADALVAHALQANTLVATTSGCHVCAVVSAALVDQADTENQENDGQDRTNHDVGHGVFLGVVHVGGEPEHEGADASQGRKQAAHAQPGGRAQKAGVLRIQGGRDVAVNVVRLAFEDAEGFLANRDVYGFRHGVPFDG